MYVSIDLGGTNTRVAVSSGQGKLLKVDKFPTEQIVQKEKENICASIKNLNLTEEIKGICLGIPGFIDKKKQKIGRVTNIPSLSGQSYTDFFKGELEPGIVIAENDASLAGLGEAILGAGQDHNVVAYLTLSTGVGGVRIAGKRIDPSQNYSEPGHMIIQEKGRNHLKCGQYGCLESYVSGTAFKDIYQMSPSDCTDRGIWADYAGKLAMGIINVLAMWGPEVVVLGGSLANKFEEYFREPLLEELSKLDYFPLPPVVKSKLGDNSGLYGGFILLEQTLDGKL